MNEDLKSHLIESLSKNIRFDGRKLDEYREIKVETGIFATAEGSARVRIGETEVLAGVKISIEQPFPDKPDEGMLMVNAELLPLSSPDFESGPPDIKSIELARIVDRALRESKIIDLKKLCLEKGEKVWGVNIDICTINDAGGLIDTSFLAALAALKDTKFPKYDNEEIDYKIKTEKPLPLSGMPISVTVIKIGNNLLIDPISVEEEAIDSRLTVGSLEDATICSLQKGGDVPLSWETAEKMIDLALEKSKEIMKLI